MPARRASPPTNPLDVLLIPFAVLVVYALHSIGFPTVLLVLGPSIFIGFTLQQHTGGIVTIKSLVRALIFCVVKIFFRDLETRGTQKLEKNEENEKTAYIFVCAPHANQFLDPMVVMSAIPGDIHWLIAAKSYRRKYVGAFAKALNAIPVERAIDLAKKGTGTISIKGKTITGNGTNFTALIQPGYSIIVNGEALTVDKIDDDTSLTVTSTLPEGDIQNAKWGASPKIDQASVFGSVWDVLGSGGRIGIFPEGGSHDRADLLPLKAGVTMMALGAMAKYEDLDVQIVPVGLNYFNGHRFRSRAYVDIGDPIKIDPEMVAKYKAGGPAKREACGTLLDTIYHSLLGVTATAPDHETLQLLWAIRRLYAPSGLELSTEQKLELTRRFENAYEKAKDNPKVQELKEKVAIYNDELRMYHLRDHQVYKTERTNALPIFIYRICLLFVLFCFALPGLILNLPIIILTRTVSANKAKQALAESNVKIKAKDVLGTWKVMTGLAILPLCFVIYPIIAALTGYYLNYGAVRTWAYFAVFQLPVMYGSIRFVETSLPIFKSLRPLWYAITHNDDIGHLRATREQLSAEIRTLVDTLGPVVFGSEEVFNKFRMIKPADIRRHSTAARASIDGKKGN